VELVLGGLVFVSLLIGGLYLTEASFLSLKVQEASVSALWNASGRRVHQFNSSQLNSPNALYDPLEDTWAGPLAAGPRTQARYEDFDGLAVSGPPRRLFTQASPMVVTCEETRRGAGPDPLSFGVPRVTPYTNGPRTVPPRVSSLLRRWYQDRGGVRCNASARISPFEMPENFMQREQGGFFQEPLHDGRALRLCGVGPSVGNRCRGGYAVLLGDWSLDGPQGHYLNHDVPRRRPGGYNRSYEAMVERLFETSGRPYGAGRQGEPDHSSRFAGAVAGERPHDARTFYMTFAGVETITEGFRYTDVLRGGSCRGCHFNTAGTAVVDGPIRDDHTGGPTRPTTTWYELRQPCFLGLGGCN
jgi:hypothetical protein